MDRVFLDANILFSAAYRRESGLKQLWRISETQLLTSGYAVEEARRNLDEAIEMVMEGNRLLAEEGAGQPASMI